MKKRNASGRSPRRSGKPLKVQEKAEIKALSEMGLSNYAIEKRTGISHNTVDKYLSDAEAYKDPKMAEKIQKIKEKEVLDLTLLNIKAKQRLHDIVPRANVIESLAVMDRTFQQIRLIEGKSTQNIATLTKIVEEAHASMLAPKDADVQRGVPTDEVNRHQPVDIEVEASSVRSA